jgi:DNA-binding CsgD family transcriptional regulator
VFGLPAEALAGHALVELVHPSVRDKLTRRLLSLAHGERNRFTDTVVTYLGTMTASIELTGIAVTNDADRVDSLIILAQPEQADSSALAYPGDTRRPLSRMDALVLEGVAAGMSTVQLAAKLFLSRGGVEYHVSALMKNLKAANRSELVSKAYSAGLFSVGSWPPRVIPDLVELPPTPRSLGSPDPHRCPASAVPAPPGTPLPSGTPPRGARRPSALRAVPWHPRRPAPCGARPPRHGAPPPGAILPQRCPGPAATRFFRAHPASRRGCPETDISP